MTRKERFNSVIDYFKVARPEAETELFYSDTYQLLVAVILSAQCTDKKVNLTTPAIFAQYPNIKALSKAEYDDLFAIIKAFHFPEINRGI
jgi:endonuclease-3